MSIMSKLATLNAQIAEADLGSPISGTASLPIEVGGAPTLFPVRSEGSTETGYVKVTAARLVDARYRVQEKASDPSAENHVLDIRLLTRSEIGVMVDGVEVPLPFHNEMWANRLLSFFGQHQGSNVAAVNQLGTILNARGWVVTDREEYESRSKSTPFDLATKGGRSMAERSKLSNGALDVVSFTLRESVYTTEDGSTRGFTDLVTDSIANLERWFTWTELVKGDPIKEAMVDRYMLAPTGAVTQTEGEGNAQRIVTFPNRADIPVFTVNVGTIDEPTLVEINLWPDDAPSRTNSEGDSNAPVMANDAL